MAHSMIVGMTGSGKTTLAKMISAELGKRGIKRAVLDPVHDPEWGANFQTHQPEEFLEYVRRVRSHVCFIDEGGQSIGRYNRPMEWTATTSRHLGHSCYFLLQGATQVPPIIRTNCATCYLFATDPTIIETISKEFNEPTLREAPRLPRFHFYMISRFESPAVGRVDLSEGTCYLDKCNDLSSVTFPEHDDGRKADGDSGGGDAGGDRDDAGGDRGDVGMPSVSAPTGPADAGGNGGEGQPGGGGNGRATPADGGGISDTQRAHGRGTPASG